MFGESKFGFLTTTANAIAAPIRPKATPVILKTPDEVDVRLQWMREQEHAWEPYGPAMVTKVSAGLDAMGKIADWRDAAASAGQSTPHPRGRLGLLRP